MRELRSEKLHEKIAVERVAAAEKAGKQAFPALRGYIFSGTVQDALLHSDPKIRKRAEEYLAEQDARWVERNEGRIKLADNDYNGMTQLLKAGLTILAGGNPALEAPDVN